MAKKKSKRAQETEKLLKISLLMLLHDLDVVPDICIESVSRLDTQMYRAVLGDIHLQDLNDALQVHIRTSTKAHP